MTDGAGPGRDAEHERRRRFSRVLTTLLRALGSTVALVAIYYLLPLDNTSIGVVVGMLAIGLLALVVLITFQVRSIIKATYPALRAVGALATSIPLFLLLFAATYFVMGSISAGSFSEPLTRTDTLYFTVTVFSTVGFGDITAKSEGARALVTGQMVAGIVIVGIGARIIVDAIKHGRLQQPAQGSDSEPEGATPRSRRALAQSSTDPERPRSTDPETATADWTLLSVFDCLLRSLGTAGEAA